LVCISDFTDLGPPRERQQTMKPITLEERDIQAIRAYHRATKCGSTPSPDSPIGRAAARAVKRQEQLHPNVDFVAKALGDEAPIDQRMQSAAVAWGRRQAAMEPPKLPVPNTGGAIDRTRESLAGIGVVDLSGDRASTIASDQQPDRFLAKMQDAEKAREIMADPATPEALRRATESARKQGRKPTAEDFSKCLAAVKAELGPRPYQPPAPVVALFAPSENAAKALGSLSYSVVPDRFTGGK
jgi:hypothetical protein